MKVKHLFVIMLFALIGLNVQAKTWDALVNEFIEAMKIETPKMEEQLGQVGIESKITTSYDAKTKDIVMDFRIDTAVWGIFNQGALEVTKESMLAEYQKSFKNDSDFAEFINTMKSNGSKFRIAYTCLENGKVMAKEFTITPDEIMK